MILILVSLQKSNIKTYIIAQIQEKIDVLSFWTLKYYHIHKFKCDKIVKIKIKHIFHQIYA